MTAYAVATDPVHIGGGFVLIQNLGPDDLYVEVTAENQPEPDLTADTGLQIGAGQSVSFDNSNFWIWGVSDGTSDVRSLEGGSGVFAAAVPDA